MIYIPRRGLRRVGRGPGVIPVPPSNVSWPSEPSGFTEFRSLTFDDTFDNAAVETGTSYTYKTVRIQKFPSTRTQVVAGAGPNGEYALRGRHPAGTTDGYSLQINPNDAPSGVHEFFTGWTFRTAPDFQNEEGYHKIFYPNIASPNSGAPILNIVPFGSGTKSGQYRWVFQQMQAWFPELNGGLGDFGDFNWPQNASSKVFDCGDWYRMELRMRTETPNVASGAQDGIVQLWASNQEGTGWATPELIFERTDIRFGGSMATTRRAWANFEYEFYRGGTGQPVLDADADLFISHLYWSAP